MGTDEFTLSDADRAAMAAADVALIEHDRVEELQRQAVLEQVKGIVSAEVYAEILEELTESGYTHDYKVTSIPVGQEQDDGASWGNTFVNQTTDGGHTGDEYAGTVSIPLGDGKFFQFAFSM